MKHISQKRAAAFALISLLASAVLAESASEELSFENVWERVEKSSDSLQAARLDAEAARIGKNRMSRHWLPRVYTDLRAFQTNDPLTIFGGTLLQREASSADFMTREKPDSLEGLQALSKDPADATPFIRPDTLNNPGTRNFGMGTLGVDLPLYEAGARSAAAEMYAKMSEALNYQALHTQLDEYTLAASAYGQLMILDREHQELKNLQFAVNSILARYQLGNAGNPVGYSGLLGLRGLNNRLEALVLQNRTRHKALLDYLGEMTGGLPENWKTKNQEAKDFAAAYLQYGDLNAGPSFRTRFYQKMVEAQEEKAVIDTAPLRPKTGLFAEAQAVTGDRGTGTNYKAGFYFQMMLVSPTDIQAGSQAEKEVEAAKLRAKDAVEKEKLMLDKLVNAEKALDRSLDLLRQSKVLLQQQTVTSLDLFQNGAINALQLTEVFSRRADLIQALSQAETEYLQVRSGLVTMRNRKGVPTEQQPE